MLRIDDIDYRIAGRTLFKNASAFIAAKQKIGIVGNNGVGKSTLFNLILGNIDLDGGEISISRNARIATVAQEAPSGDITPLDAVIAGHSELTNLLAAAHSETDGYKLANIHDRLLSLEAHSAPSRAASILAGLGFSEDAQQRPMSSFSGGWRTRVALAAVLFTQPDVLLLDEPTNYLDLEGTLWLQDYLMNYPHTLLVISHDRDLLNTVVDSILYLDGKTISLYTGGYDQFMQVRAEQLIGISAQRARQEAARKHMQSFVDRFKAKASKARQAQSRIKMIAKMAPLPELPGEQRIVFKFRSGPELASPLINIEQACVGYIAGRPILRKLDLRIDQTDRIALLGSNGSGKSTFAKLLAGNLTPEKGRITRASKLTTAFFAQHQADEFVASHTAIDHLQKIMPQMNNRELRSHLASFGITSTLAEVATERLSGGEKARLLFALVAILRPSLLILDEPTNHLDIQSREALIQAINEFEGAVILISHDTHLVDACADNLWIVGKGQVKSFDGDLKDYRKLVLKQNPAANDY